MLFSIQFIGEKCTNLCIFPFIKNVEKNQLCNHYKMTWEFKKCYILSLSLWGLYLNSQKSALQQKFNYCSDVEKNHVLKARILWNRLIYPLFSKIWLKHQRVPYLIKANLLKITPWINLLLLMFKALLQIYIFSWNKGPDAFKKERKILVTEEAQPWLAPTGEISNFSTLWCW